MRTQDTGVELSWRAITADDAPAWAELLAAAESVDHTDEHYDVDDLLEELADPDFDARRQTVAAFAGERMVAYGAVRGAIAGTGIYRVLVEGCVHPDRRRTGLGRRVFDHTAELAADAHRGKHPDVPGELRVYSHDGNVGATALLTAAGLHPARWWFDMERDLTEPPPAVPVPDGLRLVTAEPALHEALRLARNEAFADSWDYVERDESSWRQWVSGSRMFRPALSTVAMDGDQIAGFVLTFEFEADQAATGVREAWVGLVGTRKAWRGRGIASALLTHSLRSYAAAGYQRAGLNVDTGNPTGALDRYERAGFVVTGRWTTYVRPL